MVPLVEVLEERVLELFDGAPGASAVHEFGFDQADGGFGERVDDPWLSGGQGGSAWSPKWGRM